MPPLPIPLRTSVSRTPRRWNLLSAIGLLAAVCCFWQGLPAVSSLWKDQAQANVAPAPVAQRQLEHVQIKDLRPGRRVIAKNPELAGNEIPERSIDPEVDRLVSFRLEKPDGSFVEWDRIESLPDLFEAALLDTLVSLTDADVEALPASALLPENVDVRESDIDAATALRRVEQFLIGRMVDVDLAELGASGRATIQSIQPCAEVERDDGNGRRLVTAVFRHTTRDVYDLSLDDGTPSIGTTGNHPFWSVDRQQFVRADSLRHRECLQKANGSLCRVTSVTKRDLTEPVTVYNLEIDGEHVYNVGAGGVLVHNACVYQDIRNGNKVYIGWSRNFQNRQRSWKPQRTISLIVDNITNKQARALEHTLIEKYGRIQDRFGNKLGGQLENLNKGIAARKLKKYTTELQWAEEFIRKNGL